MDKPLIDILLEEKDMIKQIYKIDYTIEDQTEWFERLRKEMMEDENDSWHYEILRVKRYIEQLRDRKSELESQLIEIRNEIAEYFENLIV